MGCIGGMCCKKEDAVISRERSESRDLRTKFRTVQNEMRRSFGFGCAVDQDDRLFSLFWNICPIGQGDDGLGQRLGGKPGFPMAVACGPYFYDQGTGA